MSSLWSQLWFPPPQHVIRSHCVPGWNSGMGGGGWGEAESNGNGREQETSRCMRLTVQAGKWHAVCSGTRRESQMFHQNSQRRESLSVSGIEREERSFGCTTLSSQRVAAVHLPRSYLGSSDEGRLLPFQVVALLQAHIICRVFQK